MIKALRNILFVLSFCTVSFSQGVVDVFVIDSYITPEQPHKFVLSFFTTGNATSKLIFDSDKEYVVSSEYSEDHKIKIDISGMSFDSSAVKYYLTGRTESGEEYTSEIFTVSLPSQYKFETERNTSLLSVCCLGGVIFGLPSPTLVFKDGKKHLALSKEIPVLSFYSTGYNYPVGYLSLEYTNIVNTYKANFLRAGYKQMWDIDKLEYLSVGITAFTNFSGFNGIAPEASVGLFKFKNVFTLYTRYRFNFQPSSSGQQFHEISIGLYSNFFSLNL